MQVDDAGTESAMPVGPPADANQRRRIVERLIRRIFCAQIIVLLTALGLVLVAIVFPERLGAFFLAFCAGAIGGSLSLLKRIRVESVEVLAEVESSVVTTVMPLLYGGILASITYLLFLGCILTGEGVGGLFTSNLFPTFENLVCGAPPEGTEPPDMAQFIQVRPRQVEDIAKILIWSLIAGYSEKFVDQVLRTLEHRGQQ